jgi:tetratricopeptide (TPR) repeat protein
MDAITIGAVLLAIVGGAAGQVGGQLWVGVEKLVRRPFSRGREDSNGGDGVSELTALKRAPDDEDKAVALGEALLARAETDVAFRRALEGWWEQAAVIRSRQGPANNTMSVRTNYGVILQGDFRGAKIDLTVRAPAAGSVALAQLPPPVTGFTGRAIELGMVMGVLDPAGTAGAVVVSAVTGLAGIGKTALAIEAGHAARNRGWSRGGELFINLHGYDERPVEPAQALDALLRALGVDEEHIPAGAEARAGLYRSALAQISEPVLVIADNASSEAQVRLLLPGAGPHRMVVTSRHTLADLGARLLDVSILDEATGAALLDAALRAARPNDRRISGDLEAAGRLAGICGGLPLALQITAALLKSDPAIGVDELADELDVERQRLERLQYDDGSGAGGLSVTAAFEMSYRRLDRNSALMFRLMPIDPGADISIAAAAILADLSVAEGRGLLAALVRAHLVETAPGGPDRWRMHDLVRLYAQRLSDMRADADRREEARDRLLSYYLHLAEVAQQSLRGLPSLRIAEDFTGRDAALAWLDAERQNLVAAVTMAANTGRDHVAIRLTTALAEYFDLRRRFDDMLGTATVCLDIARGLGDRVSEGKALRILGIGLWRVRRYEEAVTTHKNAAAIFRESGDRYDEGRALTDLGIALREVQRFEEAISAHQDAATIFQEAGDRRYEGIALNNLGIVLRQVGRLEEAIAAGQASATIFGETGSRHDEGSVLGSLGRALRQVRRLEEGITAHRNAVTIFQETGDRVAEGRALSDLGSALRQAAQFDEAIISYKNAVAIFREAGDRRYEGITLNHLGNALRETERFDEAIIAHRDAVAVLRTTDDQQAEGEALRDLEVALRQ